MYFTCVMLENFYTIPAYIRQCHIDLLDIYHEAIDRQVCEVNVWTCQTINANQTNSPFHRVHRSTAAGDKSVIYRALHDCSLVVWRQQETNIGVHCWLLGEAESWDSRYRWYIAGRRQLVVVSLGWETDMAMWLQWDLCANTFEPLTEWWRGVGKIVGQAISSISGGYTYFIGQ